MDEWILMFFEKSIKRRKEEIREQLPSEPGPNDPEAIKILLKLPNGVRLERRFYKTDSLAVSFLLILCS